ncbi:hypothetical protein AB0F11_29940 [Streptomyces sp. NPDC032472]|uniref:hypothetical protein n=1 Tax=Streptomyces sp. NPDC032472 TaxID=3155018 RepID=UPI0033DCC3E0
MAPNLAVADGDCGIGYWPDSDYAGGCGWTMSSEINRSGGGYGDAYNMAQVIVVGTRQPVTRPYRSQRGADWPWSTRPSRTW